MKRPYKAQCRISIPLDIPDVNELKTITNKNGDYIITVESTEVSTTCRLCGRKITKFHSYGRWIELRHLPILGHRVYLRLRPNRFECPHCSKKTTTQQLEWYEPKSPHTKAYDRHLMLQLVNSTVQDVSHKEEVGYDAVEGAIERHIQVTVDWTQFDSLRVVGIDEIALTKGKKNFAAIISTQQADGHVAVLAVLPNREKKTVRQFLDSIPKRLWPTMETVCTDMWDGYVNAAKEFAQAHPQVSVEVVIDRFHVAKNYRDDVDTLRKKECRRLKKELSKSDYEEIKGVMWNSRQNNRNLAPDGRKKLNRLFEHSPDLKLAYTLREELTAIFEMPLTRAEGKRRLKKWRDKVVRSGSTCFTKFLKTLNNWLDEIANYFTDRLSSGFVEGLNNKVKTIKRRCYGLPQSTTLFQRLYLDLEGYRRFA